MRPRSILMALSVAVGCAFPFAANALVHTPSPGPASPPGHPFTVQPVAGSGVHFFTSAIVHSTQPTPTGLIRRSTETIELSGDLVGRVLYQPRSVFDFSNGTLVNTGHQVFSGIVLGAGPVMLHDDQFRFESDLNTGETTGEVHLIDRLAGPIVRCDLDVVGTGLNPDGNALFDYTGECRVHHD